MEKVQAILKKVGAMLRVSFQKFLSIFRWNIFKWILAAGCFVGVVIAVFATVYVVRVTKDLPSVEVLAEYKPPVMTRVHAGDGKLITEFKKEARVFVPIETIPKSLQHAFVAAEDQRFYQHNGFDEKGFARAMVANIGHILRDERLEGGSTITQQVAKNFFNDDRTIARKIREIVIAGRIEKAMDKDHILELYLNEIYFGRGAYGVAAASLNYFGKPMKDLDLADAAYLAVLPKAPNNYQVTDPNKKKRALMRRNYVLSRMIEDGYAEKEDAEAAKEKDIEVVDRFEGEEYLAAEYFVEEARKKIFNMYGEDELYEGGLSIRTTLDTKLQLTARRALRNGLEAYDRRHGYRGPLGRFESFSDWKTKLADFETPPDIDDWRAALVLETSGEIAKLGFAVGEDDERPAAGTLSVTDAEWAVKSLPSGKKGPAPKQITDVVKSGDVILVAPKDADSKTYALRQVPNVNGSIIAMDPHTGRVLALVGGYSFGQSQFNRVTQANRQPGSAFKPFVYAAALENGFTPSSQVLDAPFVIERQDTECDENERGVLELRGANEDGQTGVTDSGASRDECERFYKPSNYAAGRFYGLSTLRLGLEKSRNAMTVRLANDIGMAPIMAYGREFGIYDDPRPELAWALGAGETTLLKLATAYSILVNGGKEVKPALLDRVQNGAGETIFINGDKRCGECRVEDWNNTSPPELPDERVDVIDPVTAYQVIYMLKGVIDNGTGRAISALGRPLGGKTGTTNDYLDAWFMGFSPDLVAGVYVGYDSPRPLNGEAGATAAAPIFKEFMGAALDGQPVVPFRIPEGITLAPVNRTTGEPSYIGAPDFILEAYRPGTEPKLGGLSSTIRVGSGTDSFVGGYDDLLEDDATQSEETEKNSDKVDEAASDEAPKPATPPAPAPETPKEDDLDDGLY